MRCNHPHQEDLEGAVQVIEKGHGTGAVAQQGRAKSGLN